MAKMTMEARILGAQYITVEEKVYAKVFIGDEPDGVTEHICSVQVMNIKEGVEREVFEACANFKIGQMCRFSIETDRGGKQAVKNQVTHVEAIPERPAATAQPTAQAKPEPQKAN